jgi:tetratricopeptide (TPR) repeat protein
LSESLESPVQKGFNKASVSGVFAGKCRDLSEISTYEFLKLMWTNHLLEAELWFESTKDEDPRCSLHFAEAGFLKALLLGDSSSREVVLERLAATEKTAAELVKIWKPKGLKVFSKDSFSKAQTYEVVKCSQKLRLSLVVKAEATLFKSGTELLQRKLTTGTANFKKAWNLYQKAKKMTQACFVLAGKRMTTAEIGELKKGIEADIENLIHFGEGVIILGLTMAPRTMGKVAKAAIGADIDQSQGIKSLYDCINAKVGIRVPLALMFLTFWLVIYIPEYVPGQKERLREAHELIRFSLHYYPQSPFFYWLESYMNQKQGNLERSLKLLNRVISKTHKLGLDTVPGRLNFERAWVLFLCHEWSASAKCLTDACKSGSSSPFVKLLMGVSHCMNGSLAEGQSILEDLEKNTENLGERWASRRASRYLQRRRFQLFPFEIMYVTDSFPVLKTEWLESCLDFLGHVSMEIESFEEIEEKVIWLLVRGTIFRLLGRLQQSVKALQEGLSFESQVKEENWVIPHVNYELAMNYSKSREWNSAVRFVKEARSFKKKYEFAHSLMFKLNSLMELVVQEENKEFNK